MRAKSWRSGWILALAALAGGCGGGGGGGEAPGTPGGAPPPPAFALLQPNGGETWTASFRADVRWQPGTLAGAVDIDLSEDGGATWRVLVAATANDGSESVVVPNLVGTNVRVRVGSADGLPATPGAVSNDSEADFAIQAPFREVSTQLLARGSESLAWGDMDADGDLDLAVAGGSGSLAQTHIYRNENGHELVDVGRALDGGAAGDLAWGDYDGDGDLDLVVAGQDSVVSTSIRTRLYRNDGGGGHFSEAPAGLVGFGECSLAWGDYDGDGDLDLVLSGRTDKAPAETRLFRNDGLGVFASVPINAVATSSGDLAWGDFDADGDLDLAVTGTGSNFLPETRLYRNDGGNFEEHFAPLARVLGGSLAWVDYDGDGDLDLSLCGDGQHLGSIARIYANDGAGNFADVGAALEGVCFGDLAWGDYDADGDPDLALIGQAVSAQTSRIYRNDGEGKFTDVSAGFVGAMLARLAWGDYDGDGDLDLVTTGFEFTLPGIHLYENLGGAVNARPSRPNTVNILVGTSTEPTLVYWTGASDPESPAPALSYNLRIGTTSDGNEVGPSHSLPTGQRLLPAGGLFQNDQVGPAASLRLPAGSYVLCVQSVDAGFRASPWTTPMAFTIE